MNHKGTILFISIIVVILISTHYYRSKTTIQEEEVRAFIMSWASAVFDNTGKAEDSARLISNYFLKNGVLRGTISRLIRTHDGSVNNYLRAMSNSGMITGDSNLAEFTIENYFKYFNGVNMKGLNAVYDERNNQMLKISSDVVQYNVYMKFYWDNNPGGVNAIMTFTLKKLGPNNIKIVSLHSSPIYNEETQFVPNEYTLG